MCRLYGWMPQEKKERAEPPRVWFSSPEELRRSTAFNRYPAAYGGSCVGGALQCLLRFRKTRKDVIHLYMKTRYQWDRKLLIQVLIFFCAGMIALQGYYHLEQFCDLETNNNLRYLHQFFGLVTGISFILAVLKLRKAIPKKLKKDFWVSVGWVFKKVGEGAGRIAKAIRHALGIPDPPKRVKAKDERSFVFDMEDNDLMRRFRSSGKALRWRELESNADKIRFIYIKYINKLMKKGYKLRAIYTPLETMHAWNMEHEPSAYMFPLYTDARYSGGRRPITDEEVQRSEKYMKAGKNVV